MRRSLRVLASLAAVALLIPLLGSTAGAGPNRTIRGKVTRLGNPVAGVVVSLLDTSPDNVSEFRYTCTDSNGNYRFRNVPTGAEVRLFTGPVLDPSALTIEGNAPCTNTRFEAPTGNDWLNYVHPGIHGVWTRRARSTSFVIPVGSGAYRINIRLRAARSVCFGYRTTQSGTPGNDVLEGTNGDDVIAGRGGRDQINGRGGQDVLCGDRGNDLLRGGGGSLDYLLGGRGNRDRMIGGAGTDVCADNVFRTARCEFVLPV